MNDVQLLRLEALKLAISHMKVESRELLPADIAEQAWRWEWYIATGEWPTVAECRRRAQSRA